MGLRHAMMLGTVLLSGCAANTADFQPPPDHPANAAAAEAPAPVPSQTLALASTSDGSDASTTKQAEDGATKHDHSQMSHDEEADHAGHGEDKGPHTGKNAADEDHAQHGSATSKKISPPDSAGTLVYVCPHHPEVASDKPGKCPKCKMTLKSRKAPAGPASKPAKPAAKQGGQTDGAHHEHGGNK